MLAIAAVRDLWAPDEPRYAEVALESFARGDFVHLTLCGDPYPDKPPLAFLFAALAGAPFGFAAFALRLPTLLASLLTAWCVARLALRHHDSETALLAAPLHLTTLLVLHLGGRLQIDPLLAAFTTAAITAIETGKAPWIAGACTGLAALAKGPIAWLFIAVWLLLRRGVVRTHVHRHRSSYLAASALAVLPLAAWATLALLREPSLARELLFEQHLGRILTARSHPAPVYEPLLELSVFTLPWTPLVVRGVIDGLRSPRGSFARRSTWFVLTALAFFSVVADKRELYLLPVYPLLAILAARVAIARPVAAGRFTLVVIGLWSTALVITPLFHVTLSTAAPGVDIPLHAIAVVGVGTALVLLWIHRRAGPPQQVLRAELVGFALSSTAIAVLVLPPLDTLKCSRAVAAELAARPEKPSSIPCVGVRPEAYRFFAGLPTVADQDTLRIGPALLRDGEQFLALVWTRDLPRLPQVVRDGSRTLARWRVGSRDILLLGRAP